MYLDTDFWENKVNPEFMNTVTTYVYNMTKKMERRGTSNLSCINNLVLPFCMAWMPCMYCNQVQMNPT